MEWTSLDGGLNKGRPKNKWKNVFQATFDPEWQGQKDLNGEMKGTLLTALYRVKYHSLESGF